MIDILDMLGNGGTQEAILRDYPYLEAEDIAASLLYASRELERQQVKHAAE